MQCQFLFFMLYFIRFNDWHFKVKYKGEVFSLKKRLIDHNIPVPLTNPFFMKKSTKRNLQGHVRVMEDVSKTKKTILKHVLVTKHIIFKKRMYERVTGFFIMLCFATTKKVRSLIRDKLRMRTTEPPTAAVNQCTGCVA